MKMIIVALLFALMIFSASCSRPERPLSAAELLNLGERYLIELNFEQALVQFTLLIEVEPMNPRGFLGAAEAHIGLGNTDTAITILQQGLERLPENTELSTMLETLQAQEDEYTSEPMPEPADAALIQGEHIAVFSDFARYRFYLIDGVPQPISESEEYGTIMAYMSGRRSTDEEWDEWRPSPHYWAGLRCSDCGEYPDDGSMPEWFQMAFTHPWSGVWDGEPRIFADEANTSEALTPTQETLTQAQSDFFTAARIAFDSHDPDTVTSFMQSVNWHLVFDDYTVLNLNQYGQINADGMWTAKRYNERGELWFHAGIRDEIRDIWAFYDTVNGNSGTNFG